MEKKQGNLNHLAYLFIMIIVLSLVTSLVFSLLEYYCNLHVVFWLNVIISESCLVVPALVYFIAVGDHPLKIVKLKAIKVSTVIKTIFLTVFLSPVYLSANLISQLFVPNTMMEASTEMLKISPGILIFITAIVAPVCEEFVFRGLLVYRYQQSISVLQTILITGLLFGIMHLNFNQFCYASILGMIFVIVNCASGSIITSLLMHVFINGANSIMMLLTSAVTSVSTQEALDAAESVDIKELLISVLPFFAVLSIIGIGFSILILKSIAKKERNITKLSNIFMKDDLSTTIDQQESELSSSTDTNVFRNWATLIAILVGLFGMFGWEPLIYSLDIFR